MNNWNIASYLFFIKRNNGISGMFFDEIFHFHRFLSIYTKTNWKKIFYFQDYLINDHDKEVILNTLQFYEFIDENSRLTKKGENFLDDLLKEERDFSISVENFLSNYHGEHATENSCFIDVEIFPISCHFCKEKSCLKSNVNIIELLPTALRKWKNPYKSIKL